MPGFRIAPPHPKEGKYGGGAQNKGKNMDPQRPQSVEGDSISSSKRPFNQQMKKEQGALLSQTAHPSEIHSPRQQGKIEQQPKGQQARGKQPHNPRQQRRVDQLDTARTESKMSHINRPFSESIHVTESVRRGELPRGQQKEEWRLSVDAPQRKVSIPGETGGLGNERRRRREGGEKGGKEQRSASTQVSTQGLSN